MATMYYIANTTKKENYYIGTKHACAFTLGEIFKKISTQDKVVLYSENNRCEDEYCDDEKYNQIDADSHKINSKDMGVDNFLKVYDEMQGREVYLAVFIMELEIIVDKNNIQ